jgi:hypothetical protein
MRFREVFQKITEFSQIKLQVAQEEEHQTTNGPAVAGRSRLYRRSPRRVQLYYTGFGSCFFARILLCRTSRRA